ncbi:hypothetical protein FD754_009640 [Muntiacus muntjak]|uniref:Phosphatidate cytidylyltransferase, mitochondrial n=1 Tax=Muntiacus muntjak TaxID=9888 RepID=A0A5N3WVF7_MUNMU|nr:hypothetical protein FD754_009640 [Muntiacus muntjak]
MALQALQSSGVAFRKILSHFPEELSLAFAYGSGVYRQAGPSSDQKVSPGQPRAGNVLPSRDPVAWHSKNLKKNWNHYSFLKLIKYGVISTSVLIEDLLNWNNLYIAGDFRMVVGEDKAKVLNIVKPNMAHFRELYGSILQESPQVVYKAQQGSLESSSTPQFRNINSSVLSFLYNPTLTSIHDYWKNHSYLIFLPAILIPACASSSPAFLIIVLTFLKLFLFYIMGQFMLNKKLMVFLELKGN